MDHLAIIVKDTYTLSTLRHRVRVLKNYLINKMFTQDDENKHQIDPEDLVWLEGLGTDFLNSFNKDNTYPIFSQIDQSLEKISPLVIYLPFPTNDQIQIHLGEFIRKAFSKNLIFDTKFDPNLIAGCALSWQGIYRDYSLRKKIVDNRNQLLQNFKKYLKHE